MKLLSYFDNFLTNTVNLNQTRLDTLDDRTSSINNYLELGSHDLKKMFVQTIPQGSYAHGTIIKPVADNDEFDADILLELTEDPSWEAKDYVEQLYKAFRASDTYKEKVSRRSRCVVVNYSGDFHIDVVPYLERHGEHYITHRNENQFELTNPAGFNAWLEEHDRITGHNLVKIIRLLKYLRDYKNTFSVKSFILGMLVAERVNEVLLIGDPKHYSDVPTTLKNVLSALNEYLQANPTMPRLTDPSCPTQDFNHRWDPDEYTNFRNKVDYYSGKVTAAYEETDKLKSLALWQEVFGTAFKAPTTTASLSHTVTKAAATPPSTEKWLDQDYGISTAVDAHYTVQMVGRVRPRTGFRQYDLPSQGNRVRKGQKIRFTVTRCTVPAPYTIYWKIRNFGDEAANAGQLRGDMHRDDGSGWRDESTKYRGSHYVECYVVKNGICVAKTRQRVIVI
jgi:hypothetical protein